MIIKRGILLIMLLLVLALPVAATWAPLPTELYLRENNNAFVGGVNIRVTNLDVPGEKAQVRISSSTGTTLFQGTLSKGQGYEDPGNIRIRAEDFRYYDPVHPEVLLNVEKWVQGKIHNINFPEKMFRSDTYKTFIIVSNPGTQETDYVVEFEGKGGFSADISNQEENIKYSATIKNTIPSVSQSVTLKPGERKKLYFKARPVVKENNFVYPTFRLLTNEGYLVEEINLGEIPVVYSRTGYIEDIIAEQGMNSNDEQTIKVRVRNSWIAATDKLIVKLSSPGFKIYSESKYFRGFPYNTEELLFRVRPYGGGDFTVTATLNADRVQDDIATLDIKVIGEKVFKIVSVENPSEMKKNEKGLVFINVENNAASINDFILRMESNDFRITKPETFIQLSGQKDARVVFEIEALKGSGSGYFTVSLFDVPQSFNTNQYSKAHKMADSRTVRVRLSGEKTAVEEAVEKTIKEATKENIEEELEIIPQEEFEEELVEEEAIEDVIPTKETVTLDNMSGFFPYIVIAVLVIIAVILIIAGEGRKSPKVEIYDVEPKKKKTKKKAKKK